MAASNLPTLSNRAKLALDVLADGGQFVHRLERDAYTGRDKFRHRLIAEGHAVKGIGGAAFHELKALGFLAPAGGNTSVSSYYKLNVEAA
jgi:hypothetical protein